ncbi:MAG: histidine--tRNA ligase [Candidatus Bathyarchaeota archaeon]|nr:histidine--tRNA ligase [Candidatus Bathyarchaeota archaeon]
MPSFQPVRGMRDLLAQEAKTLNYIIAKARETAQLYSFSEAITPVVESFDLLNAKSGEEIRQRMFIFEDLGGRKVALRPEFTASIARLATNTLKNEPKPLRVFSVGSVYRYDEPQKGRYREFWQANFELMGSSKPEADAEVVLLMNRLMQNVGLQGYALKLGHVGVLRGVLAQEGVEDKTQNAVLQRMDKKEYTQAFALIGSEKCQQTLQGLLELKGETAEQTVQNMHAYLKEYPQALEAVENLSAILELITAGGCEIENVEPAFARGLEYYTGMIFEVYVPQLDIALGGGGRYDKLIEAFGGEPTPAVGMAAGIDRTALAMQSQQTQLNTKQKKRVVVIPIKDAQKKEAFRIAQMLRDADVPAEFEVMGRKMGKALEDADKRNMDYAVLVGERELQEGKVTVKDLKQRTQTQVQIPQLPEELGK